MKALTKALLMLCAAVAAASCSGEVRPIQKKATVAPVSVKVATPDSASNVSGPCYVGKVEASESASVNAPTMGKLVSIKVRQGERVTAGQVVAEIQSSAIDNSYASAKATLEQAEDGYSRLQQVYGSGSIPEVKLVEVRTQLEKARAMEASARSAKEDCLLKAPFAGTVGELFVNQGESLMIGAPVMSIVSLGKLEISFAVPESELAALGKGDIARVEIPAIGRKTQARLERKGVVASPLSHSYECVLGSIADPSGLMPGMVCKVFLSGRRSEGTVIPAGAIMTDMNGRYVWTVCDGTVSKKYVRTGEFSGTGVVITEGLSGREQVIVEGMRKVSSGMKVNTVE